MKESPKFFEKVGEYSRNGGIIAGVIGLLTSGNLLAFGALVGVSGEILRRASKTKNE